MKVTTSTKFTIKPVAAALSLLAAAGAVAAPTPNQMPGAGRVTDCSVVGCTNYGPVGSPITGLVSGGVIGIDGKVVIQWGGTGAPVDATNPAGFNIGSSGTLYFSAANPASAVLNIDASGSASQIFGLLESSVPPFGFAPAIFVANGNGVVLGAGGRIVAPTGVGLIGANLNNATAKFDFIQNNSSGTSFIDVTTGQSTVTINGAINGSATLNAPAAYVLAVGGDIVNTGNIFANAAYAWAGLRATAATDTVNAVAGTTVNRLWNVTTGNLAASPVLSTLPAAFEVASAASTLVNTGSISTPLGVILGAAAGVRSGTAGDTNPLVGIFSDGLVYADTYTSAGTVELYGVVSGYATNKSLVGVLVNQFSSTSSNEGAVVINALTPGTQPSSISAIGGVVIAGTDVAINSTINHTSMPSESVLQVQSSKSLTVTAAVGAGADVVMSNSGTGGITISGNVVGDTNKSGVGGVYIANTGKNAPTVISGNVTSYGDEIEIEGAGPMNISGNVLAADDDVYITNFGSASGNTTTISGNVTALDYLEIYNLGALSSHLNISGTLTSDYEVDVWSNGNLQLGKVDAGDYAYIGLDGLSSTLNGAVTAGTYIGYYAPAAISKAKPVAVLTAPEVYIESLNFVGVNAMGNPYLNAGEKPSAQIVTNSLVLYMYGSFNAPIAGNTNWLTNQIQVEALDPLSQVNVTISAMGAGFQAINIGVTGNAWINSGDTYTPFNAVGLTTGTTTAGGLIGNGGSQLIVNASGNLDIVDGFISAFFEFPGGIAFKAGGVLTQYVPVYNAWTLEALPYQGVFFEAPTINALSYIATNGNSWANWSVKPVAGAPTVYQITQPAPTTFGFVANPTAAKQNTYSLLITGTPVNTCAGFPPVCP